MSTTLEAAKVLKFQYIYSSSFAAEMFLFRSLS